MARAGSPAVPRLAARGVLRSARGGFTLVELLVVITIIGIILAFVMVAAMDAVRRGEERATQTLITKLDAGLSDRLEALLQTRPDYNSAHLSLANVYSTSTIQSITRAQVIAWYDFVKAEMPDVFFVQTTDANYPLNFAGNAYPTTSTTFTCSPFILPLGQADNLNTQLGATGTGVYGASYTAAAAIYKNIKAGGISYQPKGYDGVDNDGNGMVDDIAEGIPAAADQATFLSALQLNHTHSTARSEMLYALLVEGRGPLGSVFSPDDFSTSEVKDTDGDGLPEFIDAWGQPLQFFRWPLLYHSDIQRGQIVTNGTASTVTGSGDSSWTLGQPYVSVFETREQDPLDPNQQLMAPAWWFSAVNTNAPGGFTGISSGLGVGVSNGVLAFEHFFHRLSEPDPYATANFRFYWDRSNVTTPVAYGRRRAYYTKFLIVSGGPDQTVGIFRYSDILPPTTAFQLIANENNAMPFSLDVADFTLSATVTGTSIPVNTSNPSSPDPTQPNSYDLQQAAQDDISNQNLMAVGAIGGSG